LECESWQRSPASLLFHMLWRSRLLLIKTTPPFPFENNFSRQPLPPLVLFSGSQNRTPLDTPQNRKSDGAVPFLQINLCPLHQPETCLFLVLGSLVFSRNDVSTRVRKQDVFCDDSPFSSRTPSSPPDGVSCRVRRILSSWCCFFAFLFSACAAASLASSVTGLVWNRLGLPVLSSGEHLLAQSFPSLVRDFGLVLTLYVDNCFFF